MYDTSRRRWLKFCLATAGISFIPKLPLAMTQTNVQRQRVIPSSGEEIPVMGLGTARTFNVGRSENALAPLMQVMQLFIERGGTMVDSSPMYGQAERVVGDLVSSLDIADQIFFATKVWTRGKQEGMEQMENSFKLMATNHIDLMQVHNLVDTRTQLKSIRDLVERKKVRYIGITHHTPGAFDELESWIKKEKLDYVQFPYSIVNRQAETRLLPVAEEYGVATIAHRNFERGRLFGKVLGKKVPEWAKEFDCETWGNFFLKYIIAHPHITNVIPATKKSKHLIDNMNAGLGRLPDPEQRKKMVAYVERL
ncbi:MAG: aldo/keto reductase [Arenicellales bacterium]|nr:aldo/keto reductase [Arenicellales bacterium]